MTVRQLLATGISAVEFEYWLAFFRLQAEDFEKSVGKKQGPRTSVHDIARKMNRGY